MLYKIKNRNVSLQYHSFNFQSTKKNIWKIKLGLVTYHLESEQNIVKIDYETIQLVNNFDIVKWAADFVFS